MHSKQFRAIIEWRRRCVRSEGSYAGLGRGGLRFRVGEAALALLKHGFDEVARDDVRPAGSQPAEAAPVRGRLLPAQMSLPAEKVERQR
jgi:hypothetical protein